METRLPKRNVLHSRRDSLHWSLANGVGSVDTTGLVPGHEFA